MTSISPILAYTAAVHQVAREQIAEYGQGVKLDFNVPKLQGLREQFAGSDPKFLQRANGVEEIIRLAKSSPGPTAQPQ